MAAGAVCVALLLGACSADGTPSPAPTSSTSRTADAVPVLDDAARVDALQVALEGEHVAVHHHRASSGPLRGAALEQVRAAIDVHRTRRDALTALLEQADAEPVAARATYPVPPEAVPDGTPPRTRAQARTVLRAVETSLVDAYDVLSAAADPAARDLAVRARLDAQRRAARWAGAATTTPAGTTSPAAPAATVPVSP